MARPRVIAETHVSLLGVCLLYQWPSFVTHGDSMLSAELIPWRGEDSRHAISGERADGFLGR
jgi:hypothetical protein